MKSKNYIYLLFALLILSWGLSWPINKIGLFYMPALWYTLSRLLIGTLTMLLILVARKSLFLPKKQDLPLILTIGILQIAGFVVLINLGMIYVNAGRAAIIAYTTPLWITPIAMIFFKERLSALKGLGLFLGITGIFILFNPWTFDWHEKSIILGNVFLVIAAWCWSIAIIHTRYAVWHTPPLSLIFWQLLLASFIVLVTCLAIEPTPTIEWNGSLVLSILYTGIFATAFGFWGALEVSRYFSVITTSLCFLCVPVVGLLSSSIILQEPITLTLILAMGIILLGLACVSIADWQTTRKNKKIMS